MDLRTISWICCPSFPTLVARIDSQRDSIDSRESFAIETPIFIAHQADSHKSLEFPTRANHPIRANRANRFARITPLSSLPPVQKRDAQDMFLQHKGSHTHTHTGFSLWKS